MRIRNNSVNLRTNNIEKRNFQSEEFSSLQSKLDHLLESVEANLRSEIKKEV